MKTQFDWQTEVESQLEPAETAADSPPSDRRLGCLFLVLAVSAVLLGLFAWQLGQKQAQVTTAIREDITRAFELQQQAAGMDDEELFSSLLSSGDRAWKADQQRLLAAGLFNGRASAGAASRKLINIELSPDLRSAELSFSQPDAFGSGSAASTDLELQHALSYRLEDGRWLNTAPDDAFWGPPEEVQNRLFSLTFPARDAEIARLLADRIAGRLETICSRVVEENVYGRAFCDGNAPWRIDLSADSEALLSFAEASSAPSTPYDFELPAPSLLGVPVDAADLDSYLDFYTASLTQRMETALLSPAPFPDQDIYALCFDFPTRGRRLFRYDWRVRSWQAVLPTQTFDHLSALPDDSAVMLADNGTLTFFSASDASNPAVSPNFGQATVPELTPNSFVGWTTAAGHPYYIVQHAPVAGLPQGLVYGALDPQQCRQGQCRPTTLPGYPVTSEVSDVALYAAASEIALGQWLGESTEPVGGGFSPFWLDADTYGYARFADDAGGDLTTQVILANLGSGDRQVLFDGTDLARAADTLSGGSLFVNDVVPNPAVPGQLIVSATGILDYSGQYFIFTVDNSAALAGSGQPAVTLQVARSGSQGGVPGPLRPTGPLPFQLSANGRWLAMTELRGRKRDTWAVLIHDLQTGVTAEVSAAVPAMPANFPLIDWSADSQWLLVADRSFLLLYAPQLQRQEVIAHGFDACTQIVWVG